MREIKFRAMTKPPEDIGRYHFTSEMVYGTGFLKDPINTWMVSNNEREAIAFGTTEKIIKPETVGQFTGLHDKNGKEIYEGDIVRLKNWHPSYMQICFIEGAFCLADLKTGEYVGDIHYVQHADTKQAVVIGNIHENPELINA